MPNGTLGLVVLGGGAAGTGPLIWAAQHGKLKEWLGSGIAIVERSDRIGGSIGRYMLNADSLAGSFVEFLDAPPPPARCSAGLPPIPQRSSCSACATSIRPWRWWASI